MTNAYDYFRLVLSFHTLVVGFPSILFYDCISFCVFILVPIQVSPLFSLFWIFNLFKKKTQVSFSVQNLSVVCRSCRRELLTFSSSSTGPLGKFQPDLAQKHPCGKSVYICSKKG